ncbi:Ldh family oxidoreductase [Caulobacter sp. 73W]|uniref:Ldh family oxidoreductase n=1 Tax=Caulobacter sp. 73W TaxID=3161137 RepID=A0AB39KXF8_9CAUL
MFSDDDVVVLSVDEVQAVCAEVLEKAGLSPETADCIARTITAGERDACASHGVYRLPGCVLTINSPRFNKQAKPTITSVTPAFLRADADFGYSIPAFVAAIPQLVEKAKAMGVAILAINNCFHFSALWPEIERLTDHGLAAIAVTPSHGWVAPAGGKSGLLGTNPIAFGWPRPGAHPYVFDFATSAVARGDLSLHDMAGKPIPEGWGLDSEGRPTTSAREALDGAMLTFGGHKGSALSTMIELLAGPLIGDMTSTQSLEFDDEAKAAPCHGELIIAFDPKLLAGDAAQSSVDSAEALLNAFGEQGARLPSERRYAARARSLAQGVRIPRPLYDRISELR